MTPYIAIPILLVVVALFCTSFGYLWGVRITLPDKGKGGKYITSPQWEARLFTFHRWSERITFWLLVGVIVGLVLSGCAPAPRVTLSDDGQGVRRETRTDTGVKLERVPE